MGFILRGLRYISFSILGYHNVEVCMFDEFDVNNGEQLSMFER